MNLHDGIKKNADLTGIRPFIFISEKGAGHLFFRKKKGGPR